MRMLIPILAVLALACCLWWSMSSERHPEHATAGGTSSTDLVVRSVEATPVLPIPGVPATSNAMEGVVRGDDRSLAGVAVTVLGSQDQEEWSGTTDERGNFQVPHLRIGRYRVRARAGYPFVDQVATVEVQPEGSHSVVLDLPARHTLNLRVVGTAPGSPVSPLEGATVELRSTGSDGVRRRGTCDSDGALVFADLPSGNYRVSVQARDHVERTLEHSLDGLAAWRQGAPRELLVRLPRHQGQVLGILLGPEGAPLSGRMVCLVPPPESPSQRFRRRRRASVPPVLPATRTDATGRFSLDRPDGTHTSLILLAFPDRDDLPPMIGRSLPPGGSQDEHRIQLPACYPVALKLHGDRGKPVSATPRILWRSIWNPRDTFSLRWQDYPSLRELEGIEEMAGIQADRGTVRLFLPEGKFEVTWWDDGNPARPIPVPSTSIEVGPKGLELSFTIPREAEDA